MEKKQSSIEWLVEQLIPNAMRMFDATTCNAIEQSKAMHKDEIEFSYNCGWADGHDEATSESPLFTTGEEYYNETFGGEK